MQIRYKIYKKCKYKIRNKYNKFHLHSWIQTKQRQQRVQICNSLPKLLLFTIVYNFAYCYLDLLSKYHSTKTHPLKIQ